MDGLALKVHRVRHADEVRALEALGVDYIGFHVDEDAAFKIADDPLWDDDRHLVDDELSELLREVGAARPFVELPAERRTLDACRALEARGVGLLQVGARDELPEEIENACGSIGVQLIAGGIGIEPTDDAGLYGWIRPGRPCVAMYDLQVFPSYGHNAWAFLHASPPERPQGALGLDQIAALGRAAPLFLSLDAREDNVAEIAVAVAGAGLAGLSFTLSDAPLGSYHTYAFPQLERTLQALRSLTT
jgi:hypothetical protein